MAEAKIYLNVPYAEKDTAKALGARWDPAHKKWYVPAGKDITLFAQWNTDTVSLDVANSTSAYRESKASTSKNSLPDTSSTGVFTYPSNTDFKAYCGNEPPWD